MYLITMFNFNEYNFNHRENSTLEFKQNYTNKSMSKYTQTLCAFLNTRGGYIIFGVNDNNHCIGLDLTEKELDEALTSLDNIIHNSKIMIIHTGTNEKYKLKSLSITGSVITNNVGRKFIVVCAMPDNSYDKSIYKYVTNGFIYYRLNASNYFEKTEKLYTETELNYHLQRNDQNHAENNKNIVREYKKLLSENTQQQKRIKELENKLNQNICSYFYNFFNCR